MTAAAFLDRDGVINSKATNGTYVTSWSDFVFLPGVADALKALRQAGMRLIVVTNQRGVALGAMSADDLAAIHGRMEAALSDAGAPLDAVFVCPHDKGTCSCRKPGIGLFLQARDRFPDIDFDESVLVGDSLSDLVAGHRVGCRLFLVGDPDDVAATASDAADQGISIEATAPSLQALIAGGRLVPAQATTPVREA